MTQKQHRDQAASELAGALVLIAIIALAVAIIGMFWISQPPAQKIPAVSMTITNQSNIVLIYNNGGDSLSNGTYAVRVDGVDVTADPAFHNSDPNGNWVTGDYITYTKPSGQPLPQTVQFIYNQLGAASIVLASRVLTGAEAEPTLTFTPAQYYTITATAGTGGTISPSGAVSVLSGSSQSFSIMPNSGYVIYNVTVDGTSIGAPATYTFNSVTQPHTITAYFTTNLFTINTTAGTGGNITPGNVTINFGGNQTFSFVPDSGYRLANFYVDGVQNGTITSSYTFTNVTSNHTLAATFATNLSPGLIANYYLDEGWSIPGATNIASRIHFADNAGVSIGYPSDVTNWPIDYIGKDDNFSVRFDGYINISATDTYTFYLTSDDGSWLSIDGNQIIDNSGLHSATMKQTSLSLTKGLHPISVKMFENTGEAVIYLEYSNTTFTRKITDQLYHYPVNPPVADFTGSPVAGQAPLSVQFTDLSTDATAWSWNFGDGNISTVESPLHIYSTPGTYTVTLTAMNSAGANTVTKINYITVGYFLPGFNAYYYFGQTWTTLGGSRVDPEIQFADVDGNTTTHEPTDEIGWPSSMLSQQDNFSVIWDGYLLVTSADTYTFNLRSDDGSWMYIDEGLLISNGGLHSATTVSGSIALQPGYHHIKIMMYENTGQAVARLTYSAPSLPLQLVTNVWHVTTVQPAPVAGFTGAPVSGIMPMTVVFTDSSTYSPTSWSWSFGDGNTTNATIQNPVHTYSSAGTFTVSLTVVNGGGSNTMTRTNYITVVPPVPVAAFNAAPKSGNKPLTVVFTDSSTNAPTSWSWNFGDGNTTNSTVQNPVHTYLSNGTFTVSLVAANAGGSNTSTQSNLITVSNPQPVVISITPASGNRGWPVSVTNLAGSGFMSGATVKLNRTGQSDIIMTGVTVNSATQITGSFNLAGAASGIWNVVVTNTDGQSGMLANGFTINSPSPTVTSSTPNAGVVGTTVTITGIAGTGFQPGATVSYQQGATSITLTNVVVASPTQITGTLVIPSGSPTGLYNIVVTNTDGLSGTATNAFTISYPPPVVTSITPNNGNRGWSVSITNLAGSGFRSGATVVLRRAGYSDISATGVTVVSGNQITCSFNLVGTAAGSWNVVVTNTDGQTSTLTNGFTIASPAPTVTKINPATGGHNNAVPVVITGTGFQSDTTSVIIYPHGTTTGGITGTGVSITSSTQISCTFNLPNGATKGNYDVVVLNTDGQSGTYANGFKVT